MNRARRPRYDRYQELTALIEEIFVNSRSEVGFQPPAPLKGKVLEKHKDKFCLYHNAAGHTTATCFDLMDEINISFAEGSSRDIVRTRTVVQGILPTEKSKAKFVRSREGLFWEEIRRSTVHEGLRSGGATKVVRQNFSGCRGIFASPSQIRERAQVHGRGCSRCPVPASRSFGHFHNDRQLSCPPMPNRRRQFGGHPVPGRPRENED